MGCPVWQVTKRWLQASGIEFWLPLPFVAIAFWFGCSLLTAQELSQSHSTKNKLQADTQLEVHVSVNVSVINAVINRKQGITRVRVETVEPILRRLELEFPITEVNQVEATIAQELGISREDVRQLVRYEIVD